MRPLSFAVCLLALLNAASAAAAPVPVDPEAALRRELVALLEGRDEIAGLDRADPLHPLAEAPSAPLVSNLWVTTKAPAPSNTPARPPREMSVGVCTRRMGRE